MFTTACDNDLEQFPSNIASSDSLTDFNGVLSAAYHYHTGASTPMAVMGDFRADNMKMIEPPYTDFDEYNNALTSSMGDQFFAPFYSNLYKSILSSNIIINNSSNATHVAEAKFLRGLSYFKLVQVFGDVTVNLSDSPSTSDTSILVRQSANDVYNNVIIPDLTAALGALDNSGAPLRASVVAANALLGKVYVHMGNFIMAETFLANAISGAQAEGIVLESSFANVVDDGNSEIIFVTQKSTSIPDEYSPSEFTQWFAGQDSKADTPLDNDLAVAFDAAGDTTRKDLTIDVPNEVGVKYNGGLENDWIEIRLSDIILLQAETMNENSSDTAANILASLDAIRTRAGLASLSGTATTQADVRQAIADERRLELALEGHRWFDLVRTGSVDAEMGETINSNYHVFPIPNSEVLATSGVITQNAGY